ncbi:hypothetical protein B0H15DRAFT_949314 [Mycena belliarum]|uniref:Uncharacterized protein n=1 Tax=Mycena belliarum TaxID=1033014 RepID=A0AAD6XSA8_9AGAR|nr:hypothetical protein B0H15DRAFT_949314 [Mycena belliae]
MEKRQSTVGTGYTALDALNTTLYKATLRRVRNDTRTSAGRHEISYANSVSSSSHRAPRSPPPPQTAEAMQAASALVLLALPTASRQVRHARNPSRRRHCDSPERARKSLRTSSLSSMIHASPRCTNRLISHRVGGSSGSVSECARGVSDFREVAPPADATPALCRSPGTRANRIPPRRWLERESRIRARRRPCPAPCTSPTTPHLRLEDLHPRTRAAACASPSRRHYSVFLFLHPAMASGSNGKVRGRARGASVHASDGHEDRRRTSAYVAETRRACMAAASVCWSVRPEVRDMWHDAMRALPTASSSFPTAPRTRQQEQRATRSWRSSMTTKPAVLLPARIASAQYSTHQESQHISRTLARGTATWMQTAARLFALLPAGTPALSVVQRRRPVPPYLLFSQQSLRDAALGHPKSQHPV